MKSKIKNSIIQLIQLIQNIIGTEKSEKDAILIFSFPRSGSTWFMNILGAVESSGNIFEPLNPYEDNRFSEFTFHHKIYPDTIINKEEKLKKLITLLLQGKLISWWSLGHTSFYRFIKSKYILAKILRANFIFDWFCNEYPLNKKIILFRHPCSIINSMSKSPGEWHKITKNHLFKITDLSNLEKFNHIIESKNKLEELHLIQWCLETYFLAQNMKQQNVIAVFYEELFLEPETTAKKVFEFLNKEINQNIKNEFNKISNTTNKGNTLESTEPLKKWMKDYNAEQLTSFQEILDKFEIKFYSTTSHLPLKNVFNS